jgi:hypothetical protein
MWSRIIVLLRNFAVDLEGNLAAMATALAFHLLYSIRRVRHSADAADDVLAAGGVRPRR